MALTREEVLNVAKLARLKFTPEEIEKFHSWTVGRSSTP